MKDGQVGAELIGANELNGKHGGFTYSLAAAVPEILGILILLITSLVIKITGGDGSKLNTSEPYLWTLIFANQLSFFLVGAVIFRKYRIGVRTTLGTDRKPTAYYTIVGIVFTVALMFFMSPIVSLMVQGMQRLGYHPQNNIPDMSKTYNFILAIVIIGILPGIMEEMIFRGVVLGSLKNYGAVFAMVISSLLFMLMHKSLEQTIYQFTFAIALCYVALKTGSIYIPVIMHTVNNLLVLTLEYAGVTTGALAWEWIAMGVGGAIVAAICIYEFTVKKTRLTRAEVVTCAPAVPKRVFFAYAAFGIIYNAVMLVVGLFA